jgi:putative FmdB family regulatory protein
MPVYVYHCDHCDYQFDQQQKFTDNPLKQCPKCGHNTLHKVYMPVGVIYKGSGFYSTDHRSSSGSASAPRSKKDEKKEEKKSESEKVKSSTETKSD